MPSVGSAFCQLLRSVVCSLGAVGPQQRIPTTNNAQTNILVRVSPSFQRLSSFGATSTTCLYVIKYTCVNRCTSYSSSYTRDVAQAAGAGGTA
eukprot:scaffold155378_cov23-Prasinocladus_malaysianus.AAC.1